MLVFDNKSPVIGLHLHKHTINSADTVTETSPVHFIGCSFSDCEFLGVTPVFHHCVFLGTVVGLDFSRLKALWNKAWQSVDKYAWQSVDKYKLTRFHREWLIENKDPIRTLKALWLPLYGFERDYFLLHLPTLTTSFGLNKSCYRYLLAEWILNFWENSWEDVTKNKQEQEQEEEDVPF